MHVWLLVVGLLLVIAGGLAGCGVSTGANNTPGSGGPSSTATASPGSSQQSGGSWRTQVDISGSSTSSGGGTNEDVSESSTTVDGAYRVMAACQGSGSLQITLKPGGSFTVHCTPTAQDPARIAGSDSPPANHTIDITVSRQGQIEQSDVLVQVPA